MILYKAINKKTGGVYIGKTIRSLKERKKDHIKHALLGRDNYYFHSAIRKYGPEVFEWHVICDLDSSIFNETSLSVLEIWAIGNYRLLGNVYNITNGGEGTSGHRLSEEARAKIRAKRLLQPCPRTGKHLSQESIEKIRQAHLGKHLSERAKRHLSELNKGKILSEEHKEKIRKSLLGHGVSKETRKRISEAQQGRKFSEERKMKLKEAWKIRKCNFS
jgi:group I intron endonuclease